MPAWRIVGIRTAAELVALAGAAFAFIWVARIVGPAVMGDFALATAIAQIGSILIGFGTSSTAPRLVANLALPSSVAWWSTGLIRLGLALALASVLAIVLLSLGSQTALVSTYAWAIAATWLLVPLRSDWLLVANGDLAGVSASRASSMLSMAAIAFVSIQDVSDAGRVPILLVIPAVAYAIASTGFCVARGFVSGPPDARQSRGALRSLAVGSWHFIAADLSAFVYSGLDRVILYAIASPAATGLYDAAFRLIQPVYLVSTVANDSMFRPLAKVADAATNAIVMRRYALLMLGPTAPVGVFFLLFGGLTISVVYGPAFADAAPILAVLGWVITVGFVSGLMLLPMIPWGRSSTYARATTAGAGVSLIANVLLVPLYAGVGAALAGVAAKAVTGVLAFGPFNRTSPVTVWQLAKPYALATVVAGTAGYATSVVLPAPVAVVTFVIAYAVGSTLVVRSDGRESDSERFEHPGDRAALGKGVD
jgi:O-antigen/teichoic acid export membrane protein